MLQIEAQGRLSLDVAANARTAVLDGAGIVSFINQDVTEDIATGRLLRLLEDWTPPRPGFSLNYPGRRNPSAEIAAFLAMVRERAGKGATRARLRCSLIWPCPALVQRAYAPDPLISCSFRDSCRREGI